MSRTFSALALSIPSEPLVLTAARELAARLRSCQIVSRKVLNAIMGEHFRGSDADGRWSVRDAHAALEFAQVILLNETETLTCSLPADQADRAFSRLEAQVPSQTTRSEAQIQWQQFATPPRLAWLAARACALIPGESVLEPSAGTGILAVWASKAAANLALNEISPLRRECLEALFPAAPVTGFDAELIDELLDPAVSPSHR